MPEPVGTRLAAYEILEVLGRGGMGTVYRARHVNLGRLAAVKVLHADLTADKEFVERFAQEARLAAELSHPNIATVYDFGCVDERHYIAMELADGVALSRMLTEPIPLELAVSVLHQVASALGAAHAAGVVHRDLKPANILIDARGRVVLTDFGIAKSIRSHGLTVAGTLVGTPEYMAPEQALGQNVDGRTDIYALGVILYECCTGEPPFQEETPVQTAMRHVREEVPSVRARVPDLPPWVETVVARCCAKDPNARYQTVAELVAALPRDVPVPLPVYPDVLARAGVPDPGATLTEILRGETPVERALERSPDWEQMVRSSLERELTVASLDIVGSRGMKAPGKTVVLSYLFEKVRRFVDATCDEHGCFARAWSGDGLTAVFDDAAAAVRAMQSVVRTLPQFPSPEPGRQFRIRAGLDTGRAIFRGGSELGRVTSRVFDAAGHLQKSCDPDEIRASEATVRLARLQGEFHPIDRCGDVAAWAWWEPGRPRPKTKPKTGAKVPAWILAVAAVAVLVAFIAGASFTIRVLRGRARPVAAGLAARGTNGPAAARRAAPPPQTGEPAKGGALAAPSELPPAGGEPTQPERPTARIEARRMWLRVEAPEGTQVALRASGVAASGALEPLTIREDGALVLPRPGRYEVRATLEQGPASSATTIRVIALDPQGVSQTFPMAGLWPLRNEAGEPVASADRASRLAFAISLAEDGALTFER